MHPLEELDHAMPPFGHDGGGQSRIANRKNTTGSKMHSLEELNHRGLCGAALGHDGGGQVGERLQAGQP